MSVSRFALATALLLVIATSTASAAGRRADESFVYETTTHAKISGGSLPPQAYRDQPVIVTTIDITTTAVDADGSARVHVVKHAAPPGSFSPIQMKAWNQLQGHAEFDAKLTAAGALLVNVDDSYQSSQAAASGGKLTLRQQADQIVAQANDPAYQASSAAREVKGTFLIANIVSLSAAARKTLAVGDHWRSVVDGANYDLSVTGKEQYRGRDVVALKVTYVMAENPNMSSSTDATAYYDQAAGLVVGTHAVTTQDVSATGMHTVSTSELNLTQ